MGLLESKLLLTIVFSILWNALVAITTALHPRSPYRPKLEHIFNRFLETEELNHRAKEVSPLGVPPAPNLPLSPAAGAA